MDTLPISIPRQAGIYVRRSRERQGLTRAQLAEASGVSERLLASLELGDATGIRLDKLLCVFNALGIELMAQGECIAREAAGQEVQNPAIQSYRAKPVTYSTTSSSMLRRPLRKQRGGSKELSDSENFFKQESLDYQSVFRQFVQEQGIALEDAQLAIA